MRIESRRSSGRADVRVGPTHNRWRSERATVGRGPDCRELRAACLNKEQLGKVGEGNCRRYRPSRWEAARWPFAESILAPGESTALGAD